MKKLNDLIVVGVNHRELTFVEGITLLYDSLNIFLLLLQSLHNTSEIFQEEIDFLLARIIVVKILLRLLVKRGSLGFFQFGHSEPLACQQNRTFLTVRKLFIFNLNDKPRRLVAVVTTSSLAPS